MDRRRALLGALVVGLALVAGSPQRIVGDGGEYVMMAGNLAHWHRAPLGRRALAVLQERIGQFDPRLAEWDVQESSVAGRDGSRDFLHFWFYPMLAAPGVWAADLLGAPPTYGFALVNLSLLLLALWIALPRLRTWGALLLFASPILWWLDKAHTEVFTFSLLMIAFATWRDRPWWAIVVTAAASTQNPPIAVLAVAMGALAIAVQPSRLRDRRFLAGALAGALLAALHPAYTYVRHRMWSLLLFAARDETPSLDELMAVPFDPQIGLLPSYPVFGLAVGVALVALLWHRPRRLLAPEMMLSAGAVALLLFSFAQTSNFQHGATPGLSRYGLWLVPLSLPLLSGASEGLGRRWHAALAAMAIASAVVCLFAFHPRIGEFQYAPSLLARYLWTHHPDWNNPLPEIFGEVNLRQEAALAPVSTPGCEKVLLGARATGAWPIPCFPAEIPDYCVGVGAFCYANRTGGGYQFARTAGWPGVRPRPDGVWPLETEAAVRRVLTKWEWWTLRRESDDVVNLRSGTAVRTATFVRPGRMVLVLADPGPDASLMFRPGAPLLGEILDASTGLVLDVLHFTGAAGDPWTVSLPQGARLLLMRLDVVSNLGRETGS
jgi:hypothetical protein